MPFSNARTPRLVAATLVTAKVNCTPPPPCATEIRFPAKMKLLLIKLHLKELRKVRNPAKVKMMTPENGSETIVSNEPYAVDKEEEILGGKLVETVRDLVMYAPDDVLRELKDSCPESFAWFVNGSKVESRPSKPTMEREAQTIINYLFDHCL